MMQRTDFDSISEDEKMAASHIYVEIKVTWFFERSPTRFAFYDCPNCDAFNHGRFSDSITQYELVEVIGNEAVTLSRLRAIVDQKYRYDMAIAEVRKITKRDYIAAMERLAEECAA